MLKDAPEIVRILGTAFETDYLPNRAELRLKSSGRVIGYTLSLIRDETGETTGAALFFKDLTRVEQLEERERLRDRLAALGEMAAAIAHEVKNPLAGIEVMAGLLKRRLANQTDAQSMLNDIINEAKMANAIVLEVLEFVRPIRLQMEKMALPRVLQDALYMADNLVARGQTRVSLVAPDELPAIEGDPNQLRQLFTNLLTNAYEALGGRGSVAVEARHVPIEDASSVDQLATVPLVVIDVVDDGPGVPDDLRDRIFSPFFTTKPRGSGLGLAIVRKIVDAHDGRIVVTRLSTGGTRFRVTLPLAGLPDRPPGFPRCRTRAPQADRDSGSGSGRIFVEGSIKLPRTLRGTGLVTETGLLESPGNGQDTRVMGRILIADDHDSLRRGLARALAEAGHDVDEAPNGNAAIERLHEGAFDVVLSDLKMGGSDGLDVLRTAKALHPNTVVILMTAFGSVHTAVEAMRIGAFDYVPKPFEIEEMEVKIEKALEHRRLRNEIDYLRHTQSDIYDFDRIIGASGALQRVLDVVRKVARSNATVLVRGETGTGKELIAGAIHHNSSRAGRNFVKVNCAALQENLLESELFGHEKGAFTGADKQRIGRFEQADGGSLFLDEVGDMSPNTQAKILRVLQEHEFERLGGTRTIRVDVRLMTATNRNLAGMVSTGHFREDLYYRLNVVAIEMPPLRERKEDIPALAQTFIRKFSGELKKKIEGMTPEAQKLLMRYNWPGNIRELENTTERAALLCEGRLIEAEDLRLGEAPSTADGAGSAVVKLPPTGIALEEIERQALIEALKMSNWVQKDAAELLSISPRVMNYKIKVLGIDFPRGRRSMLSAVAG